jgi:hypothetical protein
MTKVDNFVLGLDEMPWSRTIKKPQFLALISFCYIFEQNILHSNNIAVA